MEGDTRLNSQLKTLGKKLFQFRDLVARIDIPEVLPQPPHDKIFWDVFIKKCTSASTVLKQVQAALTPDLYHLAVYPGDKIWRNPSAVPDLLGMPELKSYASLNPVARTIEEVGEWNTALEQAIEALEQFEEGTTNSIPQLALHRPPALSSVDSIQDKERISSLFNFRSTDRVLASSLG
jgi:hypothetical protein